MNTMKNWRYLITGLTTLAVVSFGSYSMAGDPVNPGKDRAARHHGFHHSHGAEGKGARHLQHMIKTLELSDEQRQALAAHKDEQRVNYREQRKQLHQARRALHDAIANNASEAEIAQLADKLGDLSAQQAVSRAKDKQFFVSLLTPEQKEKLEQRKSGRKNHWRDKAVHTNA